MASPLIQVQQPGQRMSRHNRRPNFPIAGTMKPYGLYPLMAHPVLPGETLQSFSSKMRTISLPVKHPMAGAWLETWVVYVKLTDLDRELGQMFISNDVSTSGWTAASDSDRYFTKSGQIDWIKLCTEKVHESYFLDEGETARTIDGVPQCKVNNVSWYQNMIFRPADDAPDTSDLRDMYDEMSGYMMLQQMQMTELTYEQYLETYGATPAKAAQGNPEILRFTRQWVQPVNTVEPTTGAPSSAWVWSQEVKLDKAKRFQEPGFIVHLATVRPKLFNANLGGTAIGNMWGFSDWFPSYNMEDPSQRAMIIGSDDKTLGGTAFRDDTAVELMFDRADLLSHGEQFVNDWTQPYRLPTSSGMNGEDAATPQDLRGNYCQSTDLDALFVDAEGDKCLYYEGMTSATVSGHVQDMTR